MREAYVITVDRPGHLPPEAMRDYLQRTINKETERADASANSAAGLRVLSVHGPCNLRTGVTVADGTRGMDRGR